MAKDPAGRLGFKNNECTELKKHPLFQKMNWGRLDAGDQWGEGLCRGVWYAAGFTTEQGTG